jgi:hypothetical protein
MRTYLVPALILGYCTWQYGLLPTLAITGLAAMSLLLAKRAY